MGGIVLFMRNNSKTESFGHFITQSSTLKKKKKNQNHSPQVHLVYQELKQVIIEFLVQDVFSSVSGASGLQNKHQRILHIKALSTGTAF